MTAIREVARRLAPSGPVRHLATAGPARRRAMAGRPLRLHPYARRRAGMSTKSTGDKSVEKSVEKSGFYDKYYKYIRGASAAIGLVSTTAGGLTWAGYWVVDKVNKGVEEKLQADRAATDLKIEAERVRSEEFRTVATKTHLDTLRKSDEIISDLRSQFNLLSMRCLDQKQLEIYYRSQILKAQEVLDREGATTSAEVHIQLLSKISDLETQMASLEEEVTGLKLIAKITMPTEDSEEGTPLNMISDRVPKVSEPTGHTKGPVGKMIADRVPKVSEPSGHTKGPAGKVTNADGGGHGS